jgi:hypothetical protein
MGSLETTVAFSSHHIQDHTVAVDGRRERLVVSNRLCPATQATSTRSLPCRTRFMRQVFDQSTMKSERGTEQAMCLSKMEGCLLLAFVLLLRLAVSRHPVQVA